MLESFHYKTIRVFDSSVNAWIFANRLTDMGLTPRLINDHLVSMTWLYSVAYGGVQVQIPNQEVEEYREFFHEETKGDLHEIAPCKKFRCGLATTWSKQLTIALLVFAALFLFCSSLKWIDDVTPNFYCPVGEPGWPWL